MMIVLVNSDEGIVTICGRTVEEIPLDDLDRIAAKVSGKKVYYVTSAEEVSGDDVLEVISSISGKSFNKKPKHNTPKKTGRMVMHSTTRGSVLAKSIDPEEDDILFDNPLDFHPIFGDIETLYSKYPDIEKYVELGYIEIMDSSEEKACRAKYKSVLDKLKRQRPGSNSAEDNKARRMIDRARNRTQLTDDSDDAEGEEDSDEDDPTRIEITDDGGDSDDSEVIIDDEQKKILRQLGKL